jgi:hypothetical protein
MIGWTEMHGNIVILRTGMHGYRDAWIQGYMDTGIHGYRDT